MSCRGVVVVVLLLASLLPDRSIGATGGQIPATATSQAAMVNDRCPVTPEEPADAAFELNVRGATVRFCCRNCVTKFERDPESYLPRLPHVPPVAPAAPPVAAPKESLVRRLTTQLLIDVPPFAERWQRVLLLLLAVLIVHWVSVRAVRRSRAATTGAVAGGDGPRVGRARGVIQALARPSTVLLLVTGIVAGRILGPESMTVRRVPSTGTGTTDAASPERTMQSRMAHQRILQGESFVTGLDKVYYRGNDDRSPRLYQGGIYRTCTMPISLRTADGTSVRPGDDIKGKHLIVRVEINRAANTLKSHFLDADLTKAFLLSREVIPSNPRKDDDKAYPFRVVESGQRWAADCEIGEVTDTAGSITGLVLVVPGTSPSSRPSEAWTAAFYGVQYEVLFDAAGKVSESSKLWMAATYFTEELPDDRVYEWLSSKPLPEIPDGFLHASELD